MAEKGKKERATGLGRRKIDGKMESNDNPEKSDRGKTSRHPRPYFRKPFKNNKNRLKSGKASPGTDDTECSVSTPRWGQ